MKQIIFCLLVSIISFVSCRNINAPAVNKTETDSVVTKVFKSSIEELGTWIDTFNHSQDPILAEYFDSIKVEYPKLLEDMKYLDSAKGLNIDFVGMIHIVSDAPHDQAFEKAVTCQNALPIIFETYQYDFIGTENACYFGPVTEEVYIDEQVDAVIQLSRMQLGQIRVYTKDMARKYLLKQLSCDFTTRKIFSGEKKPVIIGTEPKWIWNTMQSIPFLDMNHFMSSSASYRMKNLFPLLGKCRSEIAFARTVKYLMKVGKDKRAVLLYGNLHMQDFEILMQKYGTSGQFLAIPECS